MVLLLHRKELSHGHGGGKSYIVGAWLSRVLEEALENARLTRERALELALDGAWLATEGALEPALDGAWLATEGALEPALDGA